MIDLLFKLTVKSRLTATGDERSILAPRVISVVLAAIAAFREASFKIPSDTVQVSFSPATEEYPGATKFAVGFSPLLAAGLNLWNVPPLTTRVAP